MTPLLAASSHPAVRHISQKSCCSCKGAVSRSEAFSKYTTAYRISVGGQRRYVQNWLPMFSSCQPCRAMSSRWRAIPLKS